MFSLKSKLILGFSALLAVAVIVGAIGSSVVNSYGQALTRILRENYDSIVYCEGMKKALGDFRDEVQDVSLLRRDLDKFAFDTASESFLKQLELERGNITLKGERDSVAKATELWANLQNEASLLIGGTLIDSARTDRYHDRFRPLLEQLQQTIQNISDMNLSNMIAVDGQAQRSAQEAKQITFILIFVGILLALILIIITGRAILQPLKVLTQSIREVQTGNLNLVLQPRFRDEVGQLMEAFNDMAAELRALKQGDQAKLIRSQQSAQLVLDSLPDAVIVMAPDATVELANAAARRMVGVRPGGSIYDTSPEWHRSLHVEASSHSDDEDAERVVQVFVEGKEKFFMPRVLPIQDGAGLPIGLIVVFLDVTRLRRVSELENDLVSTVSHELKTPLTSVRMALHMLQDERVGQLNDKQTELLTAAKDDAERLFSIVNDLLDVARYKAGKNNLELKPVSTYSLVERAIAASRVAFQQAGVELRLDVAEELPDVLANETRIGHVFSNLLSNALKFSLPGTDVLLSVQQSEKHLEFSVADGGPGISKDELPRVFDRFYRGKSVATSEGAGLGLAIAREIVEAQGGTIRVESELGKGATFTFTLRKSTDS
jgi:NtrC-family two-component system sensor histidine kinase KinB